MLSPPRSAGEQRLGALYWLKVIVWVVLPAAFGALCLYKRLLGPAALVGAIGLGLGLRFGLRLQGWRRRSPLLVLCLLLLAVVSASLWLLARPLPGGWQRLPGTAGWSDPTLLLTGDGVLVVVTSGPKGSFWSDDGGKVFRSHGLPGPFGFALADDARRGWVWVGTAQGELLSMYDRGRGRWLQMSRPAGHVWGLALSEDRVFVALGLSGLQVTRDAVAGFRDVPGIDHCTGVAVAPDDETRLLAVGRAWFSSTDGGQRWTRLRSPLQPRFAHPGVALGGGGWSYVYEGGLLRGILVAMGPGTTGFVQRPLPASGVRVVLADPDDGRELWLGSWGQGVFHSKDSGQHWQNVGLQSIEVGSLAVDRHRRRIFAASSNLALRRGVYVRPLSDGP